MLCHLHSTQLLNLTGESCGSRPLSPPQWIGLCFCAAQSVWGKLRFLNSVWERWSTTACCTVQMNLTVNFCSTSTCVVVNGILMQTNAMWDQASLCLMRCYVVMLLCSKRWIVLHWYHVHMCRDRCAVASGVMMDVDWNALLFVWSPNNVCLCLFIVQMICISPKCYLSFKL